MILPGNDMWHDASFVGQSQVVVKDVEDRMEVMDWGATTINGQDVVFFPDGMIGTTMDQEIVRTVITVTGSDGTLLAADGMLQFQN